MGNVKIMFDHIHLISEDPESTATWYAEILGGKITNVAEIRATLQFTVVLEGATILVRGPRPGENPSRKNNLQSFNDFVSHNEWGTDHFGFRIHGNLDEFCEELKKKGATFSVEPYDFSPGIRIAYLEAPDGVSVELVQG